MTARPELSLVAAPGEFDQWGPFFLLADTLGPFLRHGEDGTQGSHLFPVSWLVHPRAGGFGHGLGLEGVGLRNADRRRVQAAAYRDTFFHDRPMRAFVPRSIVTDAPERYVEVALACRGNPYLGGSDVDAAGWAADLAHERSSKEEPSMIERGLMGTGYTSMTLPGDGSAEIEAVHAKLSDGSFLLAWAVCWYNK